MIRKIVFASDSFKGSLSCEKINEILTKTAKALLPECVTVSLLTADGGEGTLDAIVKLNNGEYFYADVHDPLFNVIKARFGVFGDNAIISMNEASGLTLVPEELRNPMNTTTFGTGELILQAVKSGYKKIYITLGGSATNDGGIGALSALGYKIKLNNGKQCIGVGSELINIKSIEKSNFNFDDVKFTILSDVENLLTGKNGATAIFARQKGAHEEDISFLENGMHNWASVIKQATDIDADKIIGGGAAGGIGAALSTFLNAEIRSGIDVVLSMNGFDEKISDADLVITGEGKIDSQSVEGKVISGVVKRCFKCGVPVIAIVGSIGEGIDKLYSMGLTSVFAIVNSPMTLNSAIENSEKLYNSSAENIFRMLRKKSQKQ